MLVMSESAANQLERQPVLPYLDENDPIGRHIIDFKNDLMVEKMPTEIEQREMIKGIQQYAYLPAARELVRTHSGIVAVVAHGFSSETTDNAKLLLDGSHALIQAAKTFDFQSSFSDYAVSHIHDDLSRTHIETIPLIDPTLSATPMERVLQRAAKLKTNPSINFTKEKQASSLDIFSAHQRMALPYVHLPSEEAAGLLGIKNTSVEAAIELARKKVGALTRPAFALDLLERGVQFEDLREPARPFDQFVDSEGEEIINLLSYKASQAAGELGIPRYLYDRLLNEIRLMAGARTRTELALMYRMDCQATAEQDADTNVVAAKLGATSLNRR
jgi:hypothetical protein